MTTEMQQNNEEKKPTNELSTLIKDVLDYGDLLLIANKGIGKTNALQVLAREFEKLPDTRLIVFEDFPKWCLEFSNESIPYLVIHDSDVRETNHVLNGEDYFLVHERDYAVLRGSEIQQALKENKNLIFVSEIQDIERQAFLIYSVVQYFYRRAYLRAYKNYEKLERIIFVIEESQNVFDSSTISKKIFNRLRKIFSVARNLDLHFVLCSQRLQDLNTKIRGRTRLLLGCVSLDDYELKISRLLRHSKHRVEITTLERGKFLYPPLDKIFSFPKFVRVGKPQEWRPTEKPQPQEKDFDRSSYPKTRPQAKASKLRNILSLVRFYLWTSKTDRTKTSEPETCQVCGQVLTDSNRDTIDRNLCRTCSSDHAHEEGLGEF